MDVQPYQRAVTVKSRSPSADTKGEMNCAEQLRSGDARLRRRVYPSLGADAPDAERPISSHHMRTCYIILCLVFSLGGAHGQVKEAFKYRGHWYELAVKFEVWRDLPFWDCEKQENPPVSASRAVKEAFKFMGKLEHRSGWSYYLDLRLKQPGANWLWEARWRRYQYIEGRREADEETRCWILMDGTVVEPVLVNNPEAKVEDGAAHGSRPIRLDTNRTSSAAGSRR